MYIKEITIEGFKSYAQTTVISQFDQHFNAITGLNGSGKSNILDAICFVLGILNLSQVRATNLQELIYKGGNAGVTKATVSILFDNTDKTFGPLGYQDYEEITVTRQISVGGKHKYLINGQNATNHRVCDLFCSVQLNVNNPNFLIMQGKITKVLNMKPAEILSMIEEAAGTKTYDLKKDNALQTIDKKNTKLNEIERVLREDITPMIEKLKQERSAYIEFQKIEREYNHLFKISVAYNYFVAEESLSKAKHNEDAINDEIQHHKTEIVQMKDKIKMLGEEIKVIQNEREGDNKLSELEAKMKEIQKEEAKFTSEVENITSLIKSEKKRQKEVENLIKESKVLLDEKQKNLDNFQKSNENAQSEFVKAQDELKNTQKMYEAICLGLSAQEDGSLSTVQDQLMNVKSKISDLNTQIKTSEINLKRARDECAKMQKDLTTASSDYENDSKAFQKVKSQVDKLKGELENLNFEPESLSELSTELRKLNQEIGVINERIQAFYTRFPQLHIDYKDPEANFDRTRVKGLVSSLFKIKDPKYATALEVAAGGKLYNLVVDNEKTGQLILQKGELKRKVTIIPMNKIKGNRIDHQVLKLAENLVGSDNVFSALSLIEYDPAYTTVMEYVFGSRLVCSSLDAAKQVAFHRQIMTSTVTLEGDHFDPEGILTGGSRGERTAILLKLNEMRRDIDELEKKKNEFKKKEAQMENLRGISTQYNNLKREYDHKMNEFNVCKTKLEQNKQHQMIEKHNSLLKEIDDKSELITKTNEELKTLNKKQAELEDKLKNQDKFKDKEKQEAQDKIKKLKEFIDKHSKSSLDFKKEYETFKMEVEVLEKEISGYDEEKSKLENTIADYYKNIESLNEKISEIKLKADNVYGEISERREILNEKNAAINSKQKECDKLEKEINSQELKIKECEHKKTNLNEKLKHASRKITELLDEHEWIQSEKDQFGKPNTVYDFKQNMNEISHRLVDMKNRKEKLSKQVDVRAMGLLAKKEEEYDELNKKRLIVLKDKNMLETTIEELEQIKIDVLKKAFQSINKDIGSIFKTLLPSANAKLEPLNRNSILDGVEFKVGFGDVWKESLTELSGGQRSLVALSFILSLLRYKPAPLYILDEVDAALDSSHTQNIGLMIKKHFKNSQFLIVSLKDGMFHNANVLFKTRLIDGVSTITRFEQNKNSEENRNKK